MRPFIFACLLVSALFLLTPQSFAQSFSAASSAEAKELTTDENTYYHVRTPTLQVRKAPRLTGVVNGQIGPPSCEINRYYATQKGERQEPPVVLIFLISSFMITIVVWGLRTAIAKRRAPLWVVGMIAGGVVSIAGFIWNHSSPATQVAFGQCSIAPVAESEP